MVFLQLEKKSKSGNHHKKMTRKSWVSTFYPVRNTNGYLGYCSNKNELINMKSTWSKQTTASKFVFQVLTPPLQIRSDRRSICFCSDTLNLHHANSDWRSTESWEIYQHRKCTLKTFVQILAIAKYCHYPLWYPEPLDYRHTSHIVFIHDIRPSHHASGGLIWDR